LNGSLILKADFEHPAWIPNLHDAIGDRRHNASWMKMKPRHEVGSPVKTDSDDPIGYYNVPVVMPDESPGVAELFPGHAPITVVFSC
jgi:hypothetical protein